MDDEADVGEMPERLDSVPDEIAAGYTSDGSVLGVPAECSVCVERREVQTLER